MSLYDVLVMAGFSRREARRTVEELGINRHHQIEANLNADHRIEPRAGIEIVVLTRLLHCPGGYPCGPSGK